MRLFLSFLFVASLTNCGEDGAKNVEFESFFPKGASDCQKGVNDIVDHQTYGTVKITVRECYFPDRYQHCDLIEYDLGTSLEYEVACKSVGDAWNREPSIPTYGNWPSMAE